MEEEQEYRTKDPVKRYHFNYDKSIGMSNMHPGVTGKDTNKKKKTQHDFGGTRRGKHPFLHHV